MGDRRPVGEWPAHSCWPIVSVQRFRDELVRFDHDLIAAMQVRIDEVAAGWLRPDIEIECHVGGSALDFT